MQKIIQGLTPVHALVLLKYDPKMMKNEYEDIALCIYIAPAPS